MAVHRGRGSVPAPMSVEAVDEAHARVRQQRRELGTSEVEFAAEDLEAGRLDFRSALKHLDCTEHRDLHVRLARVLLEVDDLRALLAERSVR